MAETSDFHTLENITKEIDNSQINILISNQCIKAQAFLLDKLKKQTDRQKEICKFIGSSNLKLETEIKVAEQEIKSLNIAIETIKLGNVELSKEYLLSKERKADIFKRTRIGKKKYDNLWTTSRKRYESIPIVQKLIEVKNKNQIIESNIIAFNNESKRLVNEIKIKKKDLEVTDRARIVELAEFCVRGRKTMIENINKNNIKINEMLTAVKLLEKEENQVNSKVSHDQTIKIGCNEVEMKKDSTLDDNWSILSKDTEKDTMMLPKLHLQNNDLDLLSIKLHEINKVDSQNTTSLKRTLTSVMSNLEENPYKIHKTDEKANKNYISYYFDIALDSDNKDDKKMYNKNYSEKKIIHILEDIKLDEAETNNILRNVQVTQFQPTTYIFSKNIPQHDDISNTQEEINQTPPCEGEKPKEVDVIEEIKEPKTQEADVVDPPSQFLDASQISQERKTVSFNIPNEVEMATVFKEDIVCSKINDLKESQEKMLNNSTASDESYTTIKDKILKKRNLDLSPQFVYSKSTLIHRQYEDNTTSKFFVSENEVTLCKDNNKDVYNKDIKQEKVVKHDENKFDIYESEPYSKHKNNVVVSSPKTDIKNLERPVDGLLFKHGPQGIPDSLNLSISTTGFEDNEDFPHCIDSSILLSPKADIPSPVPNIDNNEVLSQEVPNFLSAFRKTGLSFFGCTSSEAKPDSDAQPKAGGFNFTFGSEEKKGRGGFFSMFH